MSEIKYDELWELQESLWTDPRLPECLSITDSFPMPKMPVTREEHLINIIWGNRAEKVVMDACHAMGFKVAAINSDDHECLRSIPRSRMMDADIVVSDISIKDVGEYEKLKGAELDIKCWKGFKSYSHPRWTSPHATIDLVLRNESQTASIYFTGHRDAMMDPAGATRIAYGALHFEFEPRDKRIFDYKERMKIALDDSWTRF